ncbi:transmembrane protease serine 11G [Rattus norvegicus]|uniref:Transmembrane protease serine 11G n=1 Tax=Rattus norvegicus TaxID=10116 RepID=TM11G_RAT|nr:transmembrane protease serine 11G [Rattus norvegicus]Q5QSK2.1 RecName: Full=Transmembrane protease serine 11G; AltName: Full=Serine protease DESC4; Contains: RecName: Full=Transmembrane protease serine 11G non-catalytic chain; Contains: RecName: Full=Transmembrane protease serine 11G catalytic chain; Flags: Precursor [Rattus norvegicus]CAE84986.1 DESC4 protein [Rattus norvegicus]|eukprot:NP_001008554.1 transmembrane protease serine 11G [Rattus norvegicus]
MYQPGILGRRKRVCKPWTVALTTTAALLALAVLIGLLVYFLVYEEKTHYYQASFWIPSIKYSSDLSEEQSKLQINLKQKINNEIDVIFQRSSLKHHYVKSQVVNFRPSNDGVKADILIKFQIPRKNADTLRSEADSILNKKLQSSQSFLKRDISLPYLREMNAAQAEHILNSNCGLGMEYPRIARIADGKPAGSNSWPWQSSLQVEGIHLCGASLIGSQWLVTSAHCFDNYKNPKLWTVSFGRTLGNPLTTRKVESIIIHENYAAHKHDDDIAVVKLSSPVLFSENLRTVCLPEATFQVLPKSKVFVTGWGALKANGPFPNSLQEVEIEIISNDVCNQVNVYGGAISSGMICAGFLTGKLDACEGDSGGPLVISDNRNKWYLLGIVSWGIDCGKENKPGIYTRVTHYRNWIKSKTNI